MRALLSLGMVKKVWMPPLLLEKYQMVLELKGYFLYIRQFYLQLRLKGEEK